MAASDSWANFPDASGPKPGWDDFPDATSTKPRISGKLSPRSKPVIGGILAPTGDAHDGDTFRLTNGSNARLFGVDAFELNQTGDQGGRSVPLGQQARQTLLPSVIGGIVTPTGKQTYGRPVVTLDKDGSDAGRRMVIGGMALPTPEYLATDPARKADYIGAQREAIAAERGAYAGTYQIPSEYRHQGSSAPVRGKIAMTPEQAGEYDALIRNPKTTPAQLEAWAKTQGQAITNAGNILSFVRRNPNAKASAYWQQQDVTNTPVLPDRHNIVDRTMGAFNEGLADFAGFPVDAVNTALSFTGLPMSDRPVMGSEWLRDYMHKLGIGQMDEGYAPRSDVERYGQALARGVGQSVFPIGGTLSIGGRLAGAIVPAALEGGAIRQGVRSALSEAASNPATLIAGETGANVGANLAGQATDDYAPGNTYAQMGAQVAGGLLGGLASGASLSRIGRGTVPATTENRIIGGIADMPASSTAAILQTPQPAMAMASETPVIGGIPRALGRVDANARPLAEGGPDVQTVVGRIEPRDVLPLAASVDEAPAAAAPDVAGNIRLGRLDSPQNIQRALAQTEKMAGGFDPAQRGRITHEETQALANDLGMTPDQLLARRKGQAFNAEEALAARQILAKSGNELVNLARRVQGMDNPGDEALGAFRQALVRHVAIQEQVSGMTAEAGRTLQQFRMTADSRNVNGRVLARLADSGAGPGRLKDAADLILDNAADPAGLNRASQLALKPKFMDKVNELWINSLLSGPATHVVNGLSNTMTTLAQLPEHAAAAGIGSLRQMAMMGNAPDRVLFSELGSRAVGLLQGTREGLAQAARTLRTGQESDFANKIEARNSHAISGVKGAIIRTPTRLLSASDELFKGMARRMELSGLAVRQAAKEGLTGSERRQRAAELLANPTDEMLDKAFDYGRYVTFQRPLGHGMQDFSRFVQNTPGMKFIVPFVRTPTNLLKFAVERSPAAPLLKEWRADIGAGGARRDLALAKALVGSGVGAVAAELAHKGLITGNGPADEQAAQILRADGWQPYSIKIGNRYYSYSRLDPFATTLGVAAGMVELQDYMTEKQQDQVASLITASVMQNLSSKTWLSGMSGLIEAVNDPSRYADSWIERLVSSAAVPGIAAQTARTVDPTMREAEGILDSVRARVPGLSQSLPARRDIWGEAITSEGGLGPDIISPMRVSTRKDEPINRALLSAGVHVSRPRREWHKRRLSPQEYSEFQEMAGRLAKQRIGSVIGGPVWAVEDQEGRQKEVTDILRTARKEAGSQLFEKAAPADPWAAFPAHGGRKQKTASWDEFPDTTSLP